MKHVLIIGAGPAGLTAGYELLKQGYTVTILERSQSIGGISQTVNHNNNRMDLGGHRFFSKDDRVMQWWENIMPLQGAPALDDIILERDIPLSPGGPDPEKEDRVMLTRNRVSRIYYKRSFFDYPVSLKWSTLKTMGFITTMQVGFSYLKTVFHKLPNDSLENFYINSFGRKLYSMFFEGYTEKLWGRHPREISAQWGAQRTKELSIMGILKDMLGKIFLTKKQRAKRVQTSLIEEFRYPKLGPGHLWEQVAIEIEKMGGTIIKDAFAKQFTIEENRVVGVTYETSTGETYHPADYVISSMPICELISGIDSAPAEISDIARNLPYRDYTTVGLLVKQINLKNETQLKTLGNIIPDCWIYVQDTDVKLGRIQIFNNWSPYMAKDPLHTLWIGLEYFCNEGDDFWQLSAEECIELAKNELIKMNIINSDTEILDSHREQVLKAYPAYFDSHARIDEVIDYLNNFENLFCVGRNGQHRYNNMDHSMVTAFTAVDCLINNEDKAKIWQVNTEQDYHENKA